MSKKKMDAKEIEQFVQGLMRVKSNIDNELYDLQDRIDDLEEIASIEGESPILEDALKDIIKELGFDITNGKLVMEIAQKALLKAGVL